MRELDCIVCASRKSALLYAATYRGTVEDAHRFFLADRQGTARGDIRRCSDCGFVFTSPQFEPAEYDRIYARVGANARPAGGGPGEEATRARFERLKQRVAAHTDAGAPFLDFGCGNGDFLRAMASADGLGFEVGPPGPPQQRLGPAGTRIVSGHWPEIAGSALVQERSLGFVTAFDVFEHLPCLERDLALIARVLQPQGRLFVTVPDVASTMARAAGARWNMLLLEHLWYFSAVTLDRLLARHGFEPLAHGNVPYDAALSHVLKRLGETLGRRWDRPPRWSQRLVLPVPAGVLFAAYRKRD